MVQGKYVEVLGGERELMEAIYTKGPMTVSVDAASPGFRFYKSGVFDYDKYAAAAGLAGHDVAKHDHGCECHPEAGLCTQGCGSLQLILLSTVAQMAAKVGQCPCI